MLEFEVIKIKSKANIKAAIHKTGKLGFTKDAIEELQLDKGKYVKFAKNAKDKNDSCLYMFISGINEEGSFSVIKAGGYIYLNTNLLFSELGYDYKNKKISFLITEEEQGGTKFYKLRKREENRTSKK
ncbi:MAG: hypothetical protein JST55_13800 [Bacteroidetes bacterium]|nr:hypothetical protein [Bacteroidota bacterium]